MDLEEVYDIKVKLEGDVKIDLYNSLLDKYPNWKQFRREINLELLLDGRRIKYDIDDIQPSIYLYVRSADDINKVPFEMNTPFSLGSVGSIIKSMSFIINKDRVENLTLKIRPLNTRDGKILKELIKDIGHEYFNEKIHQYIFSDNITNFYIDLK